METTFPPVFFLKGEKRKRKIFRGKITIAAELRRNHFLKEEGKKDANWGGRAHDHRALDPSGPPEEGGKNLISL